MDRKLVYPDYANSILNIPATLLRHFGAATEHASLPVLEAALRSEPQNVVLLVFDGMGLTALERHLAPASFLRTHIRQPLTSVYPSTTTAAMTSYYSGLSPAQHGWLGWSLFFKEHGRQIDIYTDEDSFTGQAVGANAANALMPFETIFSRLHRASGDLAIHTVMPPYAAFPDPARNTRIESIEQVGEAIVSICRQPGRKLIMAYWHEPDTTLHKSGCNSPESGALIASLDAMLRRVAGRIDQSLMIISADHGLVNIEHSLYLNDAPELLDCLILPPSVEPRAISFHVKAALRDRFAELFHDVYGEDFLLLPRGQALGMGLFGPGTLRRKADDFLGDFIACATGSSLLRYRSLGGKEPKAYLAHHAGLLAGEMTVPLIVVERK